MMGQRQLGAQVEAVEQASGRSLFRTGGRVRGGSGDKLLDRLATYGRQVGRCSAPTLHYGTNYGLRRQAKPEGLPLDLGAGPASFELIQVGAREWFAADKPQGLVPRQELSPAGSGRTDPRLPAIERTMPCCFPIKP